MATAPDPNLQSLISALQQNAQNTGVVLQQLEQALSLIKPAAFLPVTIDGIQYLLPLYKPGG